MRSGASPLIAEVDLAFYIPTVILLMALAFVVANLILSVIGPVNRIDQRGDRLRTG